MITKPLRLTSGILLLAGLSLLLLAGCATTASEQALAIKDATRGEVRGCTEVGKFEGDSEGAIAIGAKYGRSNARTMVLEKAAQAGATHVVWTGGENDYWGPTAKGTGYRCPR